MRSILTAAALMSLSPPALAAQAISWPPCRMDPELIATYTAWGRGSVRTMAPPASRCGAVTVLDSAVLGGLTARTLSEALAGRVAGVSVLRSSGVAGTGSRVRFRGGSGLVIPREPILIIDGVRVDGSQASLGIGVGGQQPSRLDDLPLDDVGRIELLHGPAATALYGLDAAGGVIAVTTRTGAGGPRRWRSYVEGGAAADATDYPANSATGPPAYGDGTCTRAAAASGACTPGPLSSWNPLERASPFRTGSRLGAGASVSGGSRAIGYYAGGSASDERGVLAPNDVRRYSGRVNVDLAPLPGLRVALRGSHVAGRTTLPLGDLFRPAALYGGLMGNTADDAARRGYLDLDPATVATAVTEQRITRSLGSAAASWVPLRWLTARGLVGRELVRRDDARTFPMAVAYDDPTRDGPFQIQGSTGRDKHTTMAAALTAAYPIVGALRGATTLGAERLTRSLRKRDSLVGFFENGDPGGFSERLSHEQRKTVGTYATQQLAWTDRRTLDIGVRRDGRDRRLLLKPATYWAANASWAVSNEPFFPHGPLGGALRLHASYGVGGDTRPVRAALGGSTSIVLPRPGEEPPPLVFTPEKVSELELGSDFAWLGQRLRVGAAWYRQRSTDALEPGCCIGVLGYDYGGRWHTSGVELTVASTLRETLTSRWDAQATFATTASRYDGSSTNRSRTLDATPSFGGARRRLVPGYPIAGLWGRPLAARDANGDGVIVPSEITQAADSAYLGASIPTREGSLATSLTVFRRVTLSLHADYHGGFERLNETEAYRCAAGICAALYDPGASYSDQARAVFDFDRGPGFTERADFVRLREVALTWGLAPGWAYRRGLSGLALTVAGRNLLTFSGYSGLDPEVNFAGQSSFGSTEFFTLPLPRTFIVRLDVRR